MALLEDREALRIRLPRIERENVEAGVWPEWLSVSNLAEYLGKSPSTILMWHNNGILPRPSIVDGTKNGKRIVKMKPRKYWQRTEIDEWMKSKQRLRRTRY